MEGFAKFDIDRFLDMDADKNLSFISKSVTDDGLHNPDVIVNSPVHLSDGTSVDIRSLCRCVRLTLLI